MKLGIMQPYFFPYMGYFQLMKSVDVFVHYDDVNYIKQGWTNRNFILINGEKKLITLELKGASSFKRINQVRVGDNREKLLKTISQSYARAPYFKDILPLLERCLLFESSSLADYLINSLSILTDYLEIETTFMTSSHIEKNNDLRGQEKVLDICRLLGATEYINAIGGQELYSRELFRENSIKLHFVRTKTITYKQFGNTFFPDLSVIDVLMFNPKEKVKAMLNEYRLV